MKKQFPTSKHKKNGDSLLKERSNDFLHWKRHNLIFFIQIACHSKCRFFQVALIHHSPDSNTHTVLDRFWTLTVCVTDCIFSLYIFISAPLLNAVDQTSYLGLSDVDTEVRQLTASEYFRLDLFGYVLSQCTLSVSLPLLI